MKRIIIICEGQTEQEFCKKSLLPLFLSKDIHIQFPRIKKSNGGIVKWNELKKQIETHLKHDPSAIVTTFIDYYGISEKHNFPNWDLRNEKTTPIEKVQFIENELLNDLSINLQENFIPYIQLHEFEGLLFSDINSMISQIPNISINASIQLEEIKHKYSNPELINDGLNTAPSKRLEMIIPNYNKPVYGNIIAESIGINKIREKCIRFNNWITKLESE